MSTDQVSLNKEEPISLKEVIQTTKEWLGYLKKKWAVILAVSALGAGLGIAYAYTQKFYYKAELTFVLEDKQAGGLGAYAGIASQMGISLGGGADGGGVFTGNNIMEFLKSRMIIEKTLLSPVTDGGQTTSLAEIYLSSYEMNKNWAKNPKLKDLRLPPGTNRSGFTLQQDSLLKVLYKKITKVNLKIEKPDKVASIIAVTCNSRNPVFSRRFTERLVYEATEFYIATKTKRSKANVDKLESKADSIEHILNRKTYSAAAAQDLNLNPIRRVATVNTELATLDKTVLQVMYTEVIKSLELAKMSMLQETPLIQVIDMPIYPLEKERFGRLKGAFIGGFLGGFLILAWLVVRRLYKQIMA